MEKPGNECSIEVAAFNRKLPPGAFTERKVGKHKNKKRYFPVYKIKR
jgi:hypothetical protein